jgi:ubiquinone/menaquinone biosynthesis C-methylase UbiE
MNGDHLRARYRIWQRDRFFRSRTNSRVFEAIMRGLAAPIYRWAERCIEEDLNRASTVLDVGCGNAIFARRLSKRVQARSFSLLDQSASQIAAGRGNIAFVRKENRCEACVGSADELPLADCSFDLVVSTGSINLWRSPKDGLRECLRVARPGAAIWIFDQAPVKGVGDALDSLLRLRVFGLGIPGYTLQHIRELGDSISPEPARSITNGSLYGLRWVKRGPGG